MDLITRQVDPLQNTLLDVQYPLVTQGVLFAVSVIVTMAAVLVSRCCWPCIAVGNLGKRAWRTLTHTTPPVTPHYAGVQFVVPNSNHALLSVGLPNGVAATSDFLLHGLGLAQPGTRDAPRTFIVHIAGNPGVAAFYATFARKVWAMLGSARSNASVLTLGHANHCRGAVACEEGEVRRALAPPSRTAPSPVDQDPHDTPKAAGVGGGFFLGALLSWAAGAVTAEATSASGLSSGTCRAFSLEDQVAHKLAVLRGIQALHPGARFVLTGHSIGAWIMMEVLRRDDRIRDATHRAIGLFPTLHHIGSSPNGLRLYPLFAYGQTLAATLLDALSWSPRWFQRFLGDFFIGRQQSSLVPEGREAFLQILDGRVAFNFLGMAKDEMEQVRSCVPAALGTKDMHPRCVFFFGQADPWNAQEGREMAAVAAAYPTATCIEDTEGFPHGFVLDEVAALGVGGKVAEWCTPPTSSRGTSPTRVSIAQPPVSGVSPPPALKPQVDPAPAPADPVPLAGAVEEHQPQAYAPAPKPQAPAPAPAPEPVPAPAPAPAVAAAASGGTGEGRTVVQRRRRKGKKKGKR